MESIFKKFFHRGSWPFRRGITRSDTLVSPGAIFDCASLCFSRHERRNQMAKQRLTIEQIETRIARWETKARRAINAIAKLKTQARRLKARPAAKTVEPLEVSLERGEVTPLKIADPLRIPDFLDRSKAVAEQIRQEQADAKKAKAKGRAARKEAEKSGATKKMPLTGKAALDAIRNA